MKIVLILVLATGLYFGFQSAFFAEDKKDHKHSESEQENSKDDSENAEHSHEQENKNEAEGHEHKDSAEHDEHKENEAHQEAGHDEEGEASTAVGPDKGILEKSDEGFRLAKEAIASFELQFSKAESNLISLPKAALVLIKNDQFIYRERGGWIKKIPAHVISRSGDVLNIESSGLKSGDQVIVFGTGFVRAAELVAEEGMAGHSH